MIWIFGSKLEDTIFKLEADAKAEDADLGAMFIEDKQGNVSVQIMEVTMYKYE